MAGNSFKDFLLPALKPVGGKVMVLVPAKDAENAAEVAPALGGAGLVALIAKKFPDAQSLAEEVRRTRQRVGLVSIALGDADNTQSDKVIVAALEGQPVHVNLPYLRACYAKGILDGLQGGRGMVVNALVTSTADPELVSLSTQLTADAGSTHEIHIPTREAALILKELHFETIKTQFGPHGLDLAWQEGAARAACEAGLDLIEPSSRITFENIADVVCACLKGGVSYVMPHIFTALIDKETGATRPEAVADLVALLKSHFE